MKELDRLRQLLRYEEAARRLGHRILAGVDEAGRGPLAGPVVAAACCIPEGVFFPDINDSKQLTQKQRATLFKQITKKKGVFYGVGIISHEEIDLVNIYQATIKAMIQAINNLKQRPDYLLVDGMTLPHEIPCEKIIGGDAESQSIAAASIIAKEIRDTLMLKYHEEYPQYGFDRHKGYGTKMHVEAITKHGPCPIHRRSFEPIKSLVGTGQLD